MDASIVTPVLLIWSEVPESMKIFWVKGISPDEYAHFIGAHGTYINSSDENEHTRFVNDLLYDENGLINPYEDDRLIQIYDGDSDNTVPVTVPAVCTLVVTGFLL